MIKEAINKILDLAPIQTKKINELFYSKSGLVQITPPEFERPEPLSFNTLTGMVDHIKTGHLLPENDKETFLQVGSFGEVFLRGALQPENRNKRFLYAQSVLSAKPFMFGNWYDLETFIISLQSQFVETQEINDLISHLGHIANETIVDNTDDGFSQTIQVKTGITTKSEVVLENPMALRPYRTFMEIEQPSSNHIFRLRNKPCGMECTIIEADGDQWKLEAIQSIKAWLSDKLPEMTIIA